jgi:hypothetical protein
MKKFFSVVGKGLLKVTKAAAVAAPAIGLPVPAAAGAVIGAIGAVSAAVVNAQQAHPLGDGAAKKAEVESVYPGVARLVGAVVKAVTGQEIDADRLVHGLRQIAEGIIDVLKAIGSFRVRPASQPPNAG